MPEVETKPKPKFAEKNHKVSRTIYIGAQPIKIDFAYDLVADDAQAKKNKEAAFNAALEKAYPQGVTRTREFGFRYKLQ